MLRLITGKAGVGKTAMINEEIRDAVLRREGGRLLIVPEQYSHEAERELCRVCGDTLSLYAEVLSFTGFARKISTELGGIAVPYLDDGGRTLCMAQAMKNVGARLSVFRNAVSRPELQNSLLSTIDRMKASCVSPQMLLSASESFDGDLKGKLTDLALICEAYDGVLGQGRADPSDRITDLAEKIPSSSIDEKTVVYVDGFTDFTNAELSVLTALLAKGVFLTVCLTMDDVSGRNEVFSLPRSSAGKLLAAAKKHGVKTEIRHVDRVKEERESDPLKLLADSSFFYTEKTYDAEGKIELYCADSIQKECEAAAAKALELVRSTSCRWRDIAVAVRGYDDYAAALESTFEDYGVPLFTARRSAITSRPLPAYLSAVFSVLQNGWKSDDVIGCLETGLTGLSREDCDLLSGYLLLWNLREGDWKSGKPWRQHPDGYNGDYDEKAEAALGKINALRSRFSAPLLAFEKKIREAAAAAPFTAALAEYLRAAKIPEILSERAEELRAAGRPEDAEEYRQLWDITVSAMEQMMSILGDTPMEPEEFFSLFLITLSRYDVGSIPASLDAVTAGDFDRMRRRNIRNLIVLGAYDARLPAAAAENGLFSEDEMLRLSTTEAALGESPDVEMWREYLRIYNCLTLPSEKVILIFPAADADGGETRPSVIVRSAERLFDLQIRHLTPEECALAAPRPAFRLAVSGNGKEGTAAAAYFAGHDPDRLSEVRQAAVRMRGVLSREHVDALYGKQIRLTASRAEKFNSCRYAYFFECGLRARTFEAAEFSAPEIGTFAHYVLQHTAQDIRGLGGFRKAADEDVLASARKHIAAYRKDVLNDLQEKNARFVYLFERTADDVLQITLDTARELRTSNFEPLAFEMEFNQAAKVPSGSGEEEGMLSIKGAVDRVDGWEHDGKEYLRVVDYKTGAKKFSLSDVWYGMSLQMLLYLEALREMTPEDRAALGIGEETEIVPAGAVYVPARNRYVTVDASADEDKIAAERKKDRKRSGIVLDAPGLPEAWENGSEKIYSPLKYDKSGNPSGDGFLSPHQFELLRGHLKRKLEEMAEQLRAGSIEANPYEKGSAGDMPCRFCDFAGKCGFIKGENGEDTRLMPDLKPEDVWTRLEEEAEENA